MAEAGRGRRLWLRSLSFSAAPSSLFLGQLPGLLLVCHPARAIIVVLSRREEAGSLGKGSQVARTQSVTLHPACEGPAWESGQVLPGVTRIKRPVRSVPHVIKLP